jgi:sugar lactone lactonase YvrE
VLFRANSLGTLFVAAETRIFKISSSGIITTYVGNPFYGSTADNISASSVSVGNARRLIGDSTGNIFFYDKFYNKIRKVVAGSMLVVPFIGEGTSGYNGENIPGTSAKLSSSILSLWMETSGNLIFVDYSNYRIRKWILSTGNVQTIAGDGTLVSNPPTGTATSVSIGEVGSVVGDSLGNIFYSSQGNYRIRMITTTGIVVAYAGNGQSGYHGETVPASSARIYFPRAVRIDSSGNVYCTSDEGRILKVDRNSNIVTTVIGSGTFGYSGDGGDALAASIRAPDDFWIDSNDVFYIPVPTAFRVRKVASSIITAVAGNGLQSFSGDGGPGKVAQLNTPQGSFVDSIGNAYIADSLNCRVRMVNTVGTITTIGGTGECQNNGDGLVFSSSSLSGPTTLWGDTASNLYVASDRLIRKITVGDSLVSTVAGGGTSLDEGVAGTSYYFPYLTGIWGDTNDNLFIVDLYRHKVKKLSFLTSVIVTVAGSGVPGCIDNVPATDGRLLYPQGVWVNSIGLLFIADKSNHRIRKVDIGIITTFAGTGSFTFNGDGQLATLTNFYNPYSVSGDSQGNIYVADYGSNRIRMISSVTTTVSTVIGSGDTGYFIGWYFATSAPIDSPTHVTLDTNGNFYICTGDRVVQTVLVYDPTGQPSDRPTNQPSRQPSVHPSSQPTVAPSRQPSSQPTRHPSSFPSVQPSRKPSSQPTSLPSNPSSQPTPQPTNGPSSQPTRVPSVQPTAQPSHRPTKQPTVQPTSRPSRQPTTCPSNRPTDSPSMQPTKQPSRQPTSVPSCYPTRQPSTLPTNQPSSQPLGRPSGQPSHSPSSQPTHCPSTRPSREPTVQPSNSPSSAPTVSPTNHPTGQPSPQPSNRPSNQPNSRPTSFPTERPTIQPSCKPSSQPSWQPSVQPTVSPSNQPTKFPTVQPSDLPTDQPTSFPSSQPTACPSMWPTTRPSRSPSSQPTSQPSLIPSTQPSSLPSTQPTVRPSSQPSSTPSIFPSSVPTDQPTSNPSTLPTTEPTVFPSSRPTLQPSIRPSSCPTTQPSSFPTFRPTSRPSAQPSLHPSSSPSSFPSVQPTVVPTTQPIDSPTGQPSVFPSSLPSSQPSNQPTNFPFSFPSTQPTALPTLPPTSLPSCQPGSFPTVLPTIIPSSQPSKRPSAQPSNEPTLQPIGHPSSGPSTQPSVKPSNQPTSIPTLQPYSVPTVGPSSKPLAGPSSSPSNQPTSDPSKQPFSFPTSLPTLQPTTTPTAQPFSHPTTSPVANIYLSKGVLFFPGDPIYSSEVINGESDEILGSSYILFGRNVNRHGNFPSTILLDSSKSKVFASRLNDSSSGITADAATRSTTVIGDINNDGFLDLLIGLPLESKCLVYLGTSFGVETIESFAIIGDPERGGGQLGWASTRAGDWNYDGFDEVVVAAPYGNCVYFIFGRSEFKEDIIINNLQPNDGFKITGSQADTNFGVALSLVHDFDKDGFQDLAITAVRPGGANVIYVLLGNTNFGSTDILIDNLLTTNGHKSCLQIFTPYLSYAGYSIAGIGDINNDGYNDLSIGSIPINNAKYGTQKAYIIYGRNIDTKTDLYLSQMTRSDGFIISGGGFLVQAAGDVNSDGMADLMITNYDDWKGKGNAYLIHYPTNVTYNPTCQPSSVPSITFSAFPSMRCSSLFPSSLPSFFPISSNPTNLSLLLPADRVNQTVSVNTTKPSFKPTRIPSFGPSQTPLPSLAPSIASTQLPSRTPTSIRITPTEVATSKRKTSSPTSLHLRSSLPTTPTIPPTIRTPVFSNSTDFAEIECPEANNYFGGHNQTNTKFSISANSGTVIITGNDATGATNLYLLQSCPSEPVNVVIKNFRLSTDVISVTHLSNTDSRLIYSTLNQISYSLHSGQPLTLLFCSRSRLQVILSSQSSFALTESNFLF